MQHDAPLVSLGPLTWPPSSSQRAWLLRGVVLVALVYLGYRCVFPGASPVDFVFLWWAGKLWASGLSPYGPALHTLEPSALLAFANHEYLLANLEVQWFFYPPQWCLLAELFSTASLEHAFLAWRIFTGVCIAGGSWVLARAVARTSDAPPEQYAAFALFAVANSGTMSTLDWGQTAGVVYLGVCLFGAAWIGGPRWLMVPALVALSFKPNFGVVFLAMALASGGWTKHVLFAAGATLLLLLPVFVSFGVTKVFVEYVGVLGKFDDLVANGPRVTTGLRNLIGALTGVDTAPALLALFGAGAAVLLGLWQRRVHLAAESAAGGVSASGSSQGAFSRSVLCALLATTMCCVAGHAYDAVLIAPLILLVARVPRWALVGSALGCLMAFRADKLAYYLGILDPMDRLAAPALLLSVAFVGLAFVRWPVVIRHAAELRRAPTAPTA